MGGFKFSSLVGSFFKILGDFWEMLSLILIFCFFRRIEFEAFFRFVFFKVSRNFSEVVVLAEDTVRRSELVVGGEGV